MSSGLRRLHFLMMLALAVAHLPAHAKAQVTPEEHAKHHPEGGQAAGHGMGGPGSGGEGAGMGGMMAGMGEMMQGMHSPPQRELYPALMEFADLPLEERAAVQARAHERMLGGSARLSNGLRRLSDAAPTDDFIEMQAALGEMREGLAEFDSGLAAHRALAEGRSPKSVALQWFQREMSLLDRGVGHSQGGPFGLSWFHFLGMLLLTVFAVAMVSMYFFKMRRATNLLQGLVGTQPSEPPTASEPSPANSLEAPAVAAVATEPPPPAISAARKVRAKGPWTGQLLVAGIYDETPGIKSFRLMQVERGTLPFSFLPGQFLTLSVAPAGRPVKRSYTIASSPTVVDYAEITVKREAEGLVSRFLHDEVRVGDLLDVKAPAGTFTFTGDEADSVVLIGGGVGITPLMSVIRFLTDRAWPGEITLIYCCRTSADFVFREELEARQRRHPNLNVVASMTREAGTVWMGSKGRLTPELIQAAVPDIARKLVHLCGPPQMMEAIKAILMELGLPPGALKTEAFGPARKPAPAVAPAPPDASAVPPEVTTTPAVTATVEFARSGKSAPLPPGMPVLDVADQLGVEIENSCRTGICGSCKVTLLSGSVEMEVEDGLEPGEKEAGVILACQATSSGDVSVDA